MTNIHITVCNCCVKWSFCSRYLFLQKIQSVWYTIKRSMVFSVCVKKKFQTLKFFNLKFKLNFFHRIVLHTMKISLLFLLFVHYGPSWMLCAVRSVFTCLFLSVCCICLYHLTLYLYVELHWRLWTTYSTGSDVGIVSANFAPSGCMRDCGLTCIEYEVMMSCLYHKQWNMYLHFFY